MVAKLSLPGFRLGRRLTPAVHSHCRGTLPRISQMTGCFWRYEVSLVPRKPDLQG